MLSRGFLGRSTTLVGIGLVLLALVMVLTYWMLARQREEQQWVVHTLDVRNQISQVYTRFISAEAADRAYLLLGEAAYLAPYERATEYLPGDLEELAQLVADNPDQAEAVGHLRALIAERMSLIAQKIARRAGGDIEGAMAIMRSGRGFDLSERIRDITATMAYREDQFLNDRRAAAAEATEQLRTVLYAAFALIIVLAILAVRDSRTRLRETAIARDTLAKANTDLMAEMASRRIAEAQMRQMQKTETIGQLTGGIAHDFNNMLAIIIGSLDLARRRLGTDPEKAAQGIANAQEGAQRAAALTSRLLAFARQQPLAPAPFDANKLVGGMSELLHRTLGENVELEIVTAGGLWKSYADQPQLESAILNLCVNARDAMPDGGKLTIETLNAYLDETYAAHHTEVEPGQYVAICVTDTGTGMPQEVIDRAFDPFYTTKGIGKGTGLGLSQVYGFVKQTGGHVKIYSELGQGTTIKIYLKRWIGEGSGDSGTIFAPAHAVGGDEIILVVEDDERVRTISVDALRELGYTVVHAGNGHEALERLQTLPRVDLLFTDIVMPGMNGRKLADQAMSTRPDLKVLYTTGYTRNAVVHNGMLDPGVALLSKPFTIDQLGQKVRQVLDGAGVNRPV